MNWGDLKSELEGEVFDDPHDIEGTNRTEVYIVNIVLNEKMPELMPSCKNYPSSGKQTGCYKNGICAKTAKTKRYHGFLTGIISIDNFKAWNGIIYNDLVMGRKGLVESGLRLIQFLQYFLLKCWKWHKAYSFEKSRVAKIIPYYILLTVPFTPEPENA